MREAVPDEEHLLHGVLPQTMVIEGQRPVWYGPQGLDQVSQCQSVVKDKVGNGPRRLVSEAATSAGKLG